MGRWLASVVRDYELSETMQHKEPCILEFLWEEGPQLSSDFLRGSRFKLVKGR